MSSFLTPWKWTTTAKLFDLFLFLNPNVILETYLWSSVHFSQQYCGSTRLPRWTESTSWPSGQPCEERFGAVFTSSELKLAETYRWSKIRYLGFPKTIIVLAPLSCCLVKTVHIWNSDELVFVQHNLGHPYQNTFALSLPSFNLFFSDIYLTTFKAYLQSATLDLA